VEGTDELEKAFAECVEAIRVGRGFGAVVGEAEYLLGHARAKSNVGDRDGAMEDLARAMVIISRAQRERVGSLLQDVRALFEDEERKGARLGESRSLLTRADEAFEVLDFKAAVDLMNDALRAMLESSLLIENTKHRFLLAKDMLGVATPYLPDVGAAEARLDKSRDLYRRRKYQQSMDIAEELVSTTEAVLVEHIDEFLADMRAAIDRAEASGIDVGKARDALKAATSLRDIGEGIEALDIALGIPHVLEARGQG
jgi:tetratricopeptide (TPR) repeat protein